MVNSVFFSAITIYSIFKVLIAILSERINMTAGNGGQPITEIKMPEGGELVLAFAGAGEKLRIGEKTYNVGTDGIILPTNVANDQPAKDLAQHIFQVGWPLRDGTVVLSVDLDKNEALFVPAEIFGGEAIFDNQDNVVRSVNNDALHGHNDWRRITDDEGMTLADNWAKVTTQDPEWFWLASPGYNDSNGRVGRGGEAAWLGLNRYTSTPVPVVRSGPARSLDI